MPTAIRANYNAAELRRLDREHHLHPFSNDTMALSPPLILTRPQIDERVTSAGAALDATLQALRA